MDNKRHVSRGVVQHGMRLAGQRDGEAGKTDQVHHASQILPLELLDVLSAVHHALVALRDADAGE